MLKYSKRSTKRKVRKTFKIVTSSILALVLLCGMIFGFFLYRTNDSLSHIKRANLLPKTSSSIPVDNHKPYTFLLLGSDSRNKDDVGRSDSIMMAYVPADRKHVYLISFPRDLYVDIPGHEKQKINAAYQYGGPQLTVKTIQNFTGSTIQHVALVDFNGFVGLVDSLGGVTINNPYEGYDDSQGIAWHKGNIKLSSYSALHYVRWRHGLPDGDVTRTQNQQRVLKAIMGKALSGGVITNPFKLSDFINKSSKDVTVDNTLNNDTIKNMVLSMKINSSNDIRSITVPIRDYKDVAKYGSVDLVNDSRMNALRDALKNDKMDEYWDKYHSLSAVGETTSEIKENELIEEKQQENSNSDSNSNSTSITPSIATVSPSASNDTSVPNAVSTSTMNSNPTKSKQTSYSNTSSTKETTEASNIPYGTGHLHTVTGK